MGNRSWDEGDKSIANWKVLQRLASAMESIAGDAKPFARLAAQQVPADPSVDVDRRAQHLKPDCIRCFGPPRAGLERGTHRVLADSSAL
jgi:hypothetical protein